MVAFFDRNYIAEVNIPFKVPTISLGHVKHGVYFTRIPTIFLAFIKIRKVADESTELFVLSQDMLIPAFFLKKKRMYFEINDLRYFSNPLITFFYDLLKKIAYKKIDNLIVTSPRFRDHLIEKYQVFPGKITVMENKLGKSSFPDFNHNPFHKLGNKTLVLGIIGMLRYENVIWLLKAYQKIKHSFRIGIWGTGPLIPNVLQYTDMDNVVFHGAFDGSTDLSGIYQQIDLSFVMYDNRNLNVRLALPNKLYESMYFKKPLVVSDNTFLSLKIEELGIGFSWDQRKMEDLIEYIDSRSFISYYNSMGEKFNAISPSEIFESEDIFKKLITRS